MKKKRVSFKDELVHYFLYNEIVEGKAKDIASVIHTFVPNPHIMPIQALKQAIKLKTYCYIHKFYQLPPVLPPVDGQARKNNWFIRVTFTHGRYFKYMMTYENSYDDNRKECFQKVERRIKYKRKGTLDEKAIYFLRDLILTNMHQIKKGCMNKIFGHYWQYCGQKCIEGHHECTSCVEKRLSQYFTEI